MLLVGMSSTESISQLIAVLLIFILVLVLTLYTTRWIARYQKGHRGGSNIDIVETCPMGNGKYIQIVRMANTYVAIAVCKDSVTLLATLDEDQIVFPTGNSGATLNFKELFEKAKSLKGKSSKEE